MDMAIDINLKNFDVVYQKIIDNNNQLFAYEALTRFPSLNTYQVIQYLEQTNQFNSFGIEIFNKIVQELMNNTDIPYIFMNLAPSQLQSREDINYMINILKQHNLDNRFGFEITEDYIDFDNQIVQDNINLIKSTKALLLIDDFGTKAASIERLLLPSDIIKVDRMFLVNQDLLNPIISLINSTNKKVLIEGIETKEQLETMKLLNIDYYQGYYIHKPESINKN